MCLNQQNFVVLVNLYGGGFFNLDGVQGIVVILYNGSWGMICDDLWDKEDAQVFCRQLGYETGYTRSENSGYGESLQFILDRVQCQGDEVELGLCSHGVWGVSSCLRSEAAQVNCGKVSFPNTICFPASLIT